MKISSTLSGLTLALATTVAMPVAAAEVAVQIRHVEQTYSEKQVRQTVCDRDDRYGRYDRYGDDYTYRNGYPYYGDNRYSGGYYSNGSANNQALIGAAIGGAIGSQVSRDSTNGAIIGAVIGGTIGNQIGQQSGGTYTYSDPYGTYRQGSNGPYGSNPYGNYPYGYGNNYGYGQYYPPARNYPPYGYGYGKRCREAWVTQREPAWRATYDYRGGRFSTVLDWRPQVGQIIWVEEPMWRR